MIELLCIIESLFICYFAWYCILMFKSNKELYKLKYKYELLEQINQLNLELFERKNDHIYNCYQNKDQETITNSYMEIEKVVSKLSQTLVIMDKIKNN